MMNEQETIHVARVNHMHKYFSPKSNSSL